MLYVGYQDMVNGNRAVVLKYTGNRLGIRGLQRASRREHATRVPGDRFHGNAILGYSDVANGYRLTVLSYK